MAGSLNKVLLIGNLGRDPEVRHMNDGSKVVQLALATNETWKDKNTGERKDKTEWHRVVIFNDRLADIAERYLKKGSKIFIEGQIQTRKWVDSSSQERYTTEVILGRFRGELTLLDRPNHHDHHDYEEVPHNKEASLNHFPATKSFDELDDDIPF